MLRTEFIPAVKGPSKRLLIMLHGLGDSIAGFRWLPEALGLPWLNYLLVNAPDEYYGGYSWYDFAGDIRPGVERSRKLLFDLLDGQRQAGYATEQTILGGFSQGCLMAVETGLRYGHVFAGIVGVSGYICDPPKLVAELSGVALRQRLLITHGVLDPIVPFGITREQVRFLKGAGLNVEWHEFMKPHTIAGEEELAVIRRFIQEGFEEGKASTGR
jgi:phospholipase/carboxylesterase